MTAPHLNLPGLALRFFWAALRLWQKFSWVLSPNQSPCLLKLGSIHFSIPCIAPFISICVLADGMERVKDWNVKSGDAGKLSIQKRMSWVFPPSFKPGLFGVWGKGGNLNMTGFTWKGLLLQTYIIRVLVFISASYLELYPVLSHCNAASCWPCLYNSTLTLVPRY